MHVRPADPADFPELIEYGRLFWRSVPYSKDVPYDPQSVLRMLQRTHEARMAFVAEENLEIVGMIGGATAPMYMNDSRTVGTELFFWVSPEARDSGVGTELLKAIEHAAKLRGCTYWAMIAIEQLNGAKVGALYERAGYTWTERSYAKKL